MPPNSTSPQVVRRHRGAGASAQRIATLAVAVLLCGTLVACGDSSAGPATGARALGSRSTLARRVVACLRTHGFDLPEPTRTGHIDTRDVDVHSARYRAAVASCLHELNGRSGPGIFE